MNDVVNEFISKSIIPEIVEDERIDTVFVTTPEIQQNVNVEFLSKLLEDTDSRELNENKERDENDIIVCNECGKYYKTKHHTCNEDEISDILTRYLNRKKCEVCGESYFDDRIHFCKGKQENTIVEDILVDLNKIFEKIKDKNEHSI